MRQLSGHARGFACQRQVGRGWGQSDDRTQQPLLPLSLSPAHGHGSLGPTTCEEVHRQGSKINMPRLESSSAAVPSYVSTLRSLFSSQPPAPRSELVRALLLQSVRLRVTRERGAGDDEERLEGLQNGTLPLRVRPAFLVLNVVCLFILGLLGFHPNGQAYVSINDKILHFICFLLVGNSRTIRWVLDLTLCLSPRRRDCSTLSGTSMSQLGGCGFGEI